MRPLILVVSFLFYCKGRNLNYTEVLEQTILKPMECPEGWVGHQNNCYFFSGDQAIGWTSAEEMCKNKHKNSHLVSIVNQVEQYFIESYLKLDSYIGLNCVKVDNVWVWTDGSPVTFLNWEDGYPPQKPGRQRCTIIESDSRRQHMLGKWRNSECYSNMLQYICKFRAQTSKELDTQSRPEVTS